MEEAAKASRSRWKLLGVLAAVLALAAVWATIALAGGGSSSPTGKAPAKAKATPAAKLKAQKPAGSKRDCPFEGGQADNAAL